MPHEHRFDDENEFDAAAVAYFAGRLPEPVRAAFEAWVQADHARVQRVEGLRAIWEASAEAPAGPDADAALAQVKARIRARQVSERPVRALRLEPPVAGTRWSWAVTVRRIAAVVALAVGAGVLWRSSQLDRTPPSTWAAARTYATGRGERATVNLPDGTTVLLHNESTLEISPAFGARAREVRLTGEGYFEVAHDPTRPFRVLGSGTVTQVLGTKFDVRARPGDRLVQVAVAEGRVAVGFKRIDGGAPVLTVGQVARLSRDGSIALKRDVNVRRLLSWTEGRLVYDTVPLPEVLTELSRWFDRDFVLGNDSLASLKLTTALSGQSVAEAVKVLEAALYVRATIDGRRVVLSPR